VKKVFTTVSAYDPVNKLLVFTTVSCVEPVVKHLAPLAIHPMHDA
jgi:hypothetical protein